MKSLRDLVYDLTATRHLQAGIAQLRDLERRLPSSRSRFAVPFVYRGHGHFRSIRPRQNPVEIEGLFEAVCTLRPRFVLEIGTARGGTLYLWTQAAAPDATLVSLDLPGGEFGGGYLDCRSPLYQSFAAPGQRLHLERADSHEPSSLARVQAIFDKQPIDFAFIDGDHSYEGVRDDYNRYGTLVRPGGLIAFHDILFRDQQPDIRVDRLWAQLKERYSCTELIGPEGSGKQIGIGYLRVPEGGVQPV